MKISAIVPTYNGERYLRETLDSIAKQTRTPDEIIISDDQSGDSTCDVVRDFAHDQSFPVILLNADQTGISNNYLNAAKSASGDIIIVGDQDDIWLPNKIERIESAFERSPNCLLVSSDSEIVDKNLNWQDTTLRGGKSQSKVMTEKSIKDSFLAFLVGLKFDAHTLAFKHIILTDVLSDRFSNHAPFYFEDKVVVASMANGDYRYLPESLTLYRQHSDQHTADLSRESLVSPTRDREAELRLLLECLNEGPTSLSDEDRHARREQLERYLHFVQSRRVTTPVIKSGLGKLAQLITGDYHRYCQRPMLSISKDLISLFRS